MAEQAPTEIENLQLWQPSDSFDQGHNTAGFEAAMSRFQALSILRKPGHETVYCSGTSRIIYHTVEESDVQQRLATLQDEPATVTSCLLPELLIETSELPEEARARELNLGLGRASLFLAINAEQNSDDFMAAAEDLQHVFTMLGQRVHTIGALTYTSLRREGLIYMFVQTARKHKTLSPKVATELAEALDSGILPIPKGRDGKTSQTWGQARGRSFVERVSFVQKQPIRSKKTVASQQDRTVLAKLPHAVHFDKPAVAEKEEGEIIPKKTKAETFIFRLFHDRRRIAYPAKLAHAHQTLCGEESEPFPVRNDTKLGLSKLGFEAYLDAISLYERDSAGQILRYFSKNRGNFKSPLLPFIVIGNLMTAKVNASGGFDGKPGELPGLSAKGIPFGFRAVRYALESEAGENAENRMLGDVVEAYLRAAFAEQDDHQGHELPEAPEGFMSDTDFALAHGIGKTTLKHVLGEYGIDASTYRFGQYLKTGLSPGDQQVLESVLDELRIESAPKGTRSISGFAHLSGVAKSKVDKLIEDHGIETGTHRFRTATGQSLSPDAQRQLSELLGKTINIIE